MSKIVFEKENFKIKCAEKEDALTIYELIKGIKKKKKMLDEVENTPEMIKEWLKEEFEGGRHERRICKLDID